MYPLRVIWTVLLSALPSKRHGQAFYLVLVLLEQNKSQWLKLNTYITFTKYICIIGTSLTFSTTSEKSKKMYSVYHVERSFQRPYLFFFLSLLLFDFNEESQKARIAFYSIRRTEQTKRGEGGRVLREWGVILEHRFFFSLDICKNGVPHNHLMKFTSALLA